MRDRRLDRCVVWFGTISMIILVLLAGGVGWSREEALSCEVRRVVDGDTIEVALDGHMPDLVRVWRVRVLGVDTPELHGSTPALEALAEEATAYTRAFLADRAVTLDCRERDHFGRLLCHVYADDADLGQALLRAGLAVPYGADCSALLGGNGSVLLDGTGPQ